MEVYAIRFASPYPFYNTVSCRVNREVFARHSRPLLSDYLLSSSLVFALITFPIAGDTTRNEATNDVEQFA